MSGYTKFPSRIRAGNDNGVPSQDNTGDAEMIKRVTVTAGTILVSGRLPDNAAGTRPPYMVMSSAFAVSAGTRVGFGSPGNPTRYASLTGLNAVQATVMNVSAANYRSIGGDFIIAVSAVSGNNPSAGGFDLMIPYVITQDGSL